MEKPEVLVEKVEIFEENQEFSSVLSDNFLANQLSEIFRGVSAQKLDETEENKEETRIFATNSNKTSPFSRTQGSLRAKFDKLLISPISRPVNLVKFKKTRKFSAFRLEIL